MRIKFALIISILLANSFYDHKNNEVDFIEIVHIGWEDKPVKTVFISDKKITAESAMNIVKINGKKQPRQSQEPDSWKLSNGFWKSLIIDSRTFEMSIDFIKQYSSIAYKSKASLNNISNAILVGHKIYYLSYSQRTSFIKQLIAFLEAKKMQ
ncbi:hypothetical protein J3L18_27080 [Mucilaginibacter gossypii]|uniref:hypothetical protein n=1 Tax=Mucilaginibacter gossypii TaxID=551996 RepID=UPI000DCBBB79|nr:MULTISPECIES: hypothetical protein [Mucilaginibacter]QTE36746.1 hypothetical protein J3L18_27080 [Mucilaginibacter gossypii]RAV48302.1 hypothetical protein DIU36_28540 [Mucilaginibacter rubeus]